MEGERVERICATTYAFTAICSTGRLVTSGYTRISKIERVYDHFDEQVTGPIFTTESAFASVLGRGRVVTWGGRFYGGDNSSVQHMLEGEAVEFICSNHGAFAVMCRSGRAVVWGHSTAGGKVVEA